MSNFQDTFIADGWEQWDDGDGIDTVLQNDLQQSSSAPTELTLNHQEPFMTLGNVISAENSTDPPLQPLSALNNFDLQQYPRDSQITSLTQGVDEEFQGTQHLMDSSNTALFGAPNLDAYHVPLSHLGASFPFDSGLLSMIETNASTDQAFDSIRGAHSPSFPSSENQYSLMQPNQWLRGKDDSMLLLCASDLELLTSQENPMLGSYPLATEIAPATGFAPQQEELTATAQSYAEAAAPTDSYLLDPNCLVAQQFQSDRNYGNTMSQQINFSFGAPVFASDWQAPLPNASNPIVQENLSLPDPGLILHEPCFPLPDDFHLQIPLEDPAEQNGGCGAVVTTRNQDLDSYHLMSTTKIPQPKGKRRAEVTEVQGCSTWSVTNDSRALRNKRAKFSSQRRQQVANVRQSIDGWTVCHSPLGMPRSSRKVCR